MDASRPDDPTVRPRGSHRAGTAWPRIVRGLRAGPWLPPRQPALPWRRLAPRATVHRVSCALLCALFLAYVGAWTSAHRGYLFDPQLQNDDARFGLFAFHQYSRPPTLRDDPIANDAMARLPPGVWLLYRCLTPLTGLPWAPKIVQGICLAIVALSAVLLARARRGGLAGAILLMFLMLHTPFVVNKIAGGHGRAFMFPLLGLWIAGAAARSGRWRFAATAAATLFYPPAVLLLLAAEGVLTLLELPRSRLEDAAQRLRRYAMLAAACAACMLPQALRHAHAGRAVTLAEAMQEPAFVHGPRRVLPFEPPLSVGVKYFQHPFTANGASTLPAAGAAFDALGAAGPWIVIAACMVLVALRRAPPPQAAAAILVAAIVTWAAARGLAFRLYSPVRYLWYGSVASALALAVSTLGSLWPALRPRASRAARRNFAALAAIALAWAVGDGMIRPGAPARDGTVRHNGMSIDRRDGAALYAFIETLPPDVRIAMHPGDGAGITWWTGRATTEHHETLQPWWREPWDRAKARTFETLRALYATREDQVLRYCEEYHVTHLLLHAGRYGEQFRANALLWPPFDGFVNELLSALRPEDLVMRGVPRESVVYDGAPWIVVDAARLRQAWAPATARRGAPGAGIDPMGATASDEAGSLLHQQ